MKILALSDCLADYHSFWIRVGQYLKALPSEFDITITDCPRSINQLMEGDRLLIYRHQNEWGDISAGLKAAKGRGVIILSDVDDYLWNDGESRGWHHTRLLHYTRALRQCHLITCSTSTLSDQLSVMFRQQTIKLVPNTAPILVRRKFKFSQNERIRIGWTGAPWTRPQDLALIKPLAEWISQKSDTLQLVHLGHHETLPSLAQILNIDPRLIETKPLQNHQSYLQDIDFDIGLAPLADTCFNQFKSAIKVMEYSTYSIPWLASDALPYRELCAQWQWAGRLCRTADDWIQLLQPLLNATQRIHEGQALAEHCRLHASFDQGVNRWLSVLSLCHHTEGAQADRPRK